MTKEERNKIFKDFMISCIPHDDSKIDLNDQYILTIQGADQFCYINDKKEEKKTMQYELGPERCYNEYVIHIAEWDKDSNYHKHNDEDKWWDHIDQLVGIDAFLILIQQQWIEMT